MPRTMRRGQGSRKSLPPKAKSPRAKKPQTKGPQTANPRTANPRTAGPSDLVVRSCLNLEREAAVGAMRIYHDAFPAAQRVADGALLRLVPRGTDEPGGWIFHLAERPSKRKADKDDIGSPLETVGFAVGLHVSPLGFAYIAYLAVNRDERGSGIGTALFRSLVERWQEARPRPPHWVFLEVERPELAASDEDRELRRRRIHFYERFGCRRIHADFQAPPLGPSLPIVPYWILVLPFADADLGEPALRMALIDIYREVYGLKEDHPLVINCLRSLRV